MIILIAASNIFEMGGMQRVTIDLANNLVLRGHQVILAGENNTPPKSTRPLYTPHKNIQLINISNDYGIFKKEFNLKRKIYKIIKRLHPFIPKKIMNHKIMWQIKWNSNYLFRIQAWKYLCLKLNPDIVIGVLPNTFTVLAQALKDTNISFITNNHNDPWKDYSTERYDQNPIDVEYRKLAPELATANTVLLPEFREFFSENVKLRTYVIPNPVYHVLHKDRNRKRTSTNTKTIIATGRFVKVKDYSTLIKSFHLLANEFHDWQLKIFGDGPLYTELNKLIDKLGLNKRAFLCNHTDSIEEQYIRSDILAMPSHHEGWGLSLTEAMSYGLPVIGFNNASGVNSLIKHNINGFLADGENRVESLAHYLKRLMQDSKLRARFGEAGMEFIEQFEPNKIYDLWERVLIEVYEKKSKNLNSNTPITDNIS